MLLIFVESMNDLLACSVASVMSDSLDPVDYSLSGLSMGILQARVLEWVALFSSRGSSQPRDRTRVSCIAGRFFTIEPPGKSQVNAYQSSKLKSTDIRQPAQSHIVNSNIPPWLLAQNPFLYAPSFLVDFFIHSFICQNSSSCKWQIAKL